MNSYISRIIAELNNNGVKAFYGFRNKNSVRPVGESTVYIFPEKVNNGKVYAQADVYSPFEQELSGCMQFSQDVAAIINECVVANDIEILRTAFSHESIGYAARITFNVPFENAGGINIKFNGFQGQDELIINAEVLDVKMSSEFSPYPIFTLFDSKPQAVVYESMKYTVTLTGVHGGLGSVLSEYGIFDMSIKRSDGEFKLHRCYVERSDEPYGNMLTVVGYLKE